MWTIMLVNATLYYDSTVRKRRYGTTCDDCGKFLDIGEKVKRAKGSTNQYGCMTYYETCIKCWEKLLPQGILESEKALKEYMSQEKKGIRKLKKMNK